METGKKYKDWKIIVGHGIALRPEGHKYIRRFFLRSPKQTFGQWLKIHQQLVLDNETKKMKIKSR